MYIYIYIYTLGPKAGRTVVVYFESQKGSLVSVSNLALDLAKPSEALATMPVQLCAGKF